MSWIMKQLRKDYWSPEAAGVGLGLVYILAIWLTSHTPGAAGTFFKVSSIVGRPLTLDNPRNTFFARTFTPITDGMNWQAWLIIGVFLGALLSVLLARNFKLSLMPDVQWRQVFGGAIWKRWAIAFIGGMILQIGAGIAGGCTSGLALAGGVQLSPAAFLFIPGIFISGAIVQWLVYRRHY
jgi:hypothetical protein